MIKYASLFVILFGLTATSYADNGPNVAGTWIGMNYTSKVKNPSKVIVNFSQENTKISGNYWAATGVAGLGKGLVTGTNTFRVEWVNITTNCPGTYSNEYIVEANKLTWTFKGKDCLGEETGHGSAARK